MSKRFILAIIGFILPLAVGAQTLDAGLGYSVSDARYNRMFGGQVSLLLPVGERLSIGPQLGYYYWHYRELYEFHVEGFGNANVNMRAAASAPFVGVHGNYLLNAPERNFRIYAGLMLQAALFTEFVRRTSPSAELVMAPRFGFQVPLTAEYSPESNKALGFYFRVLPGYVLPSNHHQELNYSFVGSIFSMGGQLGVRYQFQGKE